MRPYTHISEAECARSEGERAGVGRNIGPSNENTAVPSKIIKEKPRYSRIMRRSNEFGLNPEESKVIYKKITAVSMRFEKSARKKAQSCLS